MISRAICVAAVAAIIVAAGRDAALASGYDDLLVNTTVAGWQQDPDIAVDANGNSLIVWAAQPYDGGTIHARLYDNSGSPISGELSIPNPEQANRIVPRVCARDGGGWVVAWRNWSTSGMFDGHRVQALSAAGDLAGDQLQATAFGDAPDADDHDVTCIPGGGFVLVYSNDFQQIIARRFSAELTPSGSIVVGDAGIVGRPIAESDAQGRVLVVWDAGCPFYFVSCPMSADGSGSSTQARLIDASWVPAGPEFRVNTATEGSQGHTGFAAAFAPDGGFMITFTSGDYDWQTSMAICGHSPCGVLIAKKFAADATPIGEEFTVNTDMFGDHLHPAVASDGAGGFLVIWELEQDDLYARAFDADGVPAGGQFLLNHNEEGYSRIPEVVNVAGNFHVAWLGGRAATGRDIQHRLLTSIPDVPTPPDPPDPEDPPGPGDPPDEVAQCPSVPEAECTISNPGKFRIRDGTLYGSLRWKWSRTDEGRAAQSLLGGALLCIYRNGELIAQNTVPGLSSEHGAEYWRSGSNRWIYARKTEDESGVEKMKLASRSVSSGVSLSAKTADATLTRSASTVVVQLYTSDGACWQAPGTAN